MDALIFLTLMAPLAVTGSIGTGYSEIKFLCLALQLIFIPLFFLFFPKNPTFNTGAPVWGLVAAALLDLISFRTGINPGLYYLTVLKSLFLVAFVALVPVTRKDIRLLATPLKYVLPAILIGVVFMTFGRIALFGTEPFGSTIGSKNAVPIFAIQLLPIFFLARAGTRFAKIGSWILFSGIFWVAIVNRTRTAWWMILILFVGLSIYARLIRRRTIRRLWVKFSFCLMTAIFLTLLLPNALRWKSDTPYLDSLATLADFEASSGRNHLWRVGVEMLQSQPFRGVGAGNYPNSWRKFILPSGADPLKFGFLSADLPLFNDYLQKAVESGLPAALALVFCFLIWPARILFDWLRHFYSQRFQFSLRPSVFFSLLSILVLGFAAIPDYPLCRSENLSWAGWVLNYVNSQWRTGKTRERTPKWRSLFRVLAIVPMLGTVLITSKFISGVYLRSRGVQSHQAQPILDGLRLWPYDSGWSEPALRILLDNQLWQDSKKLVSSKREFWPEDPDGWLLMAEYQFAVGNDEETFVALGRSLTKTEGGICHRPAFKRLANFLGHSRGRKFILRVTPEFLSDCQKWEIKRK